MSRVCRNTNRNCVFLDALAYFSLIRFQELAYIPRFYRRFPEFLCVPVIDSHGKLKLRRAHFGTKSSKSSPASLARWGFPKWLGLSFGRSTAPPVARHENGTAFLLKIFTSIPQTTLTRFILQGAEYDVVKLEFSSTDEAKTFAAGIIVFTFDYLSKTSVTPMNEELVLSKIQESEPIILAHARSPLFTRHRFPIEASFTLQPLPPYLWRNVNLQTPIALVRFRFMMSALRKVVTNLTSSAVEDGGVANGEEELWESTRIVLWCSRRDAKPNSNTNTLDNAELAALTRMEMREFKEFSRKMIESERKLKAQLHDRVRASERLSIQAVLSARQQKNDECRAFREELRSLLENYNLMVESDMLDRYERSTLQKIRRLQSENYVKRCRQEAVDRVVDEARSHRDHLAMETEVRAAEEASELRRKKSLIEGKKSQRLAAMATRRFFREQGDVLLALSRIKS